MAGFGAARSAAFDAVARQQQRQLFQGMSAHDRHRKMVHDLVAYYGGQLPQEGQAGPQKTDYDILRENHRFIRSEADDAADSWEVRLAKKYYSKLFKEYAIADLSRHREGRVGLRWRTQREVVNGTGQFACGAKGCGERRGLASFEVPFAYEEAGERKQALVKLRLCPEHAFQLNYRKHKEAERAHRERQRRREGKEREGRAAKRGKDKQRAAKKRRRDASSSSGETASSSSSSDDSSSGEDGRQRGGGKRRRDGSARGGGAIAAPAAAAAAAAGGGPAAPAGTAAEDEFETFFQGLFE